jgi:hypothetical protein
LRCSSRTARSACYFMASNTNISSE